VFAEARREGFVRVRVDGTVHDLEQVPTLDKNRKHEIEVVVDRLTIDPRYRERLADSVSTALELGGGLVNVHAAPSRSGSKIAEEERLFSRDLACGDCGISYQELEPRMFSFNSPYGACEPCGGLGTRMEVDPQLVLNDPRLSILEGVVKPCGEPGGTLARTVLPSLAEAFDFDLNTPWVDLPHAIQRILLSGTGDRELEFQYETRRHAGTYTGTWEGIVGQLQRRYEETESDSVRRQIEEYMAVLPCHFCEGRRLRPEALAVQVGGKGIGDVVAFPVYEAHRFFTELKLESRLEEIGGQILKEIRERLGFLVAVGLEYLTLERSAGTLAGGEAQRIRLATQIGSHLVGVLYVLDEPSIGLHQRDNHRLLETLKRLRDLGNTVLVVEHDEETIRAADHVIDLGPGAGREGGAVVAEGSPANIEECPESITGAYLRGERAIEVPSGRREGNGEKLKVIGARQHNLKDLTVEFPLATFICVTGVSGSGKSSLVWDVLHPALAQALNRSRIRFGEFDRLEGVEHVDKVIAIDQSPIGRTPRSNPATYTGVFTPIRAVFAELPESKMRGYDQGRFSFNVSGGRCEACGGEGLVKIEMHFLPDVYVPCEECKGKRYNRETLEIYYKGKTIADVLDMTVEEALEFFRRHPKIHRKLQTLHDVGLGYITLGQSATTLSGGEAQRVKLSAELAKVATGRTFYILDEPTTGLHFEDVKMLLGVLHRLVDRGNTVVVIEHNIDVVKTADWLIDLGPEGGDRGGDVVAAGTPESLAAKKESYTGTYIQAALDRASVATVQ
jgi:excinuclease ABC subunit A